MTPGNWWNAIIGCAAAVGAVVSVVLELDWLIGWSLVSCAVMCAVSLAWDVYQEMKGPKE